MSSAAVPGVQSTLAGSAASPSATSAPTAKSPFRHVRYENLLAGVGGGVVSTLILHPLDLVKIRFAGELLSSSPPPKKRTLNERRVVVGESRLL